MPELRKYNRTIEDWNRITLFQVLPCLNIGEIVSLMDGSRKINFAIGWLCWILEWSFQIKKGEM